MGYYFGRIDSVSNTDPSRRLSPRGPRRGGAGGGGGGGGGGGAGRTAREGGDGGDGQHAHAAADTSSRCCHHKPDNGADRQPTKRAAQATHSESAADANAARSTPRCRRAHAGSSDASANEHIDA